MIATQAARRPGRLRVAFALSWLIVVLVAVSVMLGPMLPGVYT